MARIINGQLFVSTYDSTGSVGEYTFTNAIFTNKADATGQGSLAINVGFIVIVPSADINTSEPIAGVAHRYKITSIQNQNGTNLSATILWDDEGSEIDTPLNESYAIVSEPTENFSYSLPISTAIYSDLPNGIVEAAYNVDLKHITDKFINGSSGYSGISGISGDSGTSGYSGCSGSGFSGYSGNIGVSGSSGFSGIGTSGYSGQSGNKGYSGISGQSGISGCS